MLDVILRSIRQQKAGGPIGLFGFEQTSARTCPSFKTDALVLLANSVGHRYSMMSPQRIERPVGIGHHPDSSILAD